MSAALFLTVLPIMRGVPFTHAIDVGAILGAAAPADMTGWALKADLRDKPGGTLYATARTSNGTLIVTAPTIAELRLTAAQTAAISIDMPVLDLRRLDAGFEQVLPFIIDWPVRSPVTQP